MKILIIGAGVIGATYGWQLSTAGHDVSILARPGRKLALARDGFDIHYTDERTKPKSTGEVAFRPTIVDDWDSRDGYQLVIVAVRAQQLDELLPGLAARIGSATVLFFGNNWWGDEHIRQFLPASKYLFGFSRLVGGWRTEDRIECILFDAPGMVTMLGEPDGLQTERLRELVGMFQAAHLRPVISRDILGWLSTHYVEFLGAVGAILQIGSVEKFAENKDMVRAAILATREGLDVCKARGIAVKKAASMQLRLYSLPLWFLIPVAQMNYRLPGIQQFLSENIANGLEELGRQYSDVVTEG